jgi:signal transduction histidine kinase
MDIKIVIKRTLIFAGIFAIAYAITTFSALFLQSGFEKFFANHKIVGLSALHTASWPAIILFGIKINVFSVPPFIVSILTLCLGLFVYLRNRRIDQNKIYLFLCLSVFLWLFAVSITLSLMAEERVIDFWSRIVFVGVTFIPITFCHFIVSLLKLTGYKRFVKIVYLAGLFFMPLLFLTNLYISGVHKFYWGYYPKAGKFFSLTVLFFVSLYGNSLYLLYKNIRLRDVDVQERSKIKYALIAFFIGSLACIDYIANYGYCIYPFGYIFIITMLLIIAYAIFRHQLLDVEVVIKKTLLFAGIFISVYAIFAFFALLSQTFFERYITANRWIAMIPSVIVVTIMLRPIENFLIDITDRHLFQKKYDYKKLLKIFMSEVLTVLEMDKLVALTNSRLMEIMKIRSCEVTLGDVSRDAELKVPIIFRGQVMGALLLGKKKSDKDYTQEDVDMLQSLSKTLGVAISNAKLFDEIVKAQAKMAEKDKMATIGTLAAGMAHEIRNPITTIRNFADYLPEKHDDSTFISKFEKLIPREIDRVESIARSLLEFSSAEDPESREEFPVDEPMKIVIGLLGPRYRTSEISIHCDYKEGHVVVANKIQLQDAFFNIMNYILAETQDGGKIFMECAIDKKGLSLSIKAKDLIVADQIIKDIFEPISGLHGEKRGFGFNLFVAKQLLERNGATLKITSDKIDGSKFRIDFMNASVQP